MEDACACASPSRKTPFPRLISGPCQVTQGASFPGCAPHRMVTGGFPKCHASQGALCTTLRVNACHPMLQSAGGSESRHGNFKFPNLSTFFLVYCLLCLMSLAEIGDFSFIERSNSGSPARMGDGDKSQNYICFLCSQILLIIFGCKNTARIFIFF